MDIFMSILALLAGTGVFITGMNMMADGLQKSAGAGMKKLIGTVSNNRFLGVGIGAGVTGIIQSSAATTVMAIGFVNAGIMTLIQATPIIMGANIGTTVTGIIVSLKSLPISEYAAALSFIGVMMTFFKNVKVKNIGSIICGLGIIFIGLELMSAAFAGENEGKKFKEMFIEIFTAIEFPLLLIIVGMLLTALIQSSSALTGIVIIMVGQGALELDSALFIILGSNIGTCITAILASLNGNVNAKRTAFIHFAFNFIGTVIFTAIIWPLKTQVVGILTSLISKQEMQVAWFHVIFNVTTTCILLPFVKQLVKLSETVVKDKFSEEHLKLKFVDDRLINTPSIAIMQAKKEVEYMAGLAKINIEKSYEALISGDAKLADEIAQNEVIIDFTNKELTKFLIKLSAQSSSEEEKVIGAYFHVLNDLERIGDHAENFYQIGVEMKEKSFNFSDTAKAEIKQMHEEVLYMFDIALESFDSVSTQRLGELSVKEDVVDKLKKKNNENHVQRLATGNCTTDLSAYFFSTVAGFERVADHLVNVGYSIVNPTGSTHDN